MRLPCAAQLHRSQLRCVYGIGHVQLRCKKLSLLVPHAKNNNQKNEGVYFEYEAVDPDAAEELLALEEEDEEQFSWAQRSRDRKKAHQNKVRSLLQDGNDRRQRKGGKRGPRANDAAARERRQAAADAAAAIASDGPILPSFSPVETPAMRARAITPEELLIRPKPMDAAPPTSRSVDSRSSSSAETAANGATPENGDATDAAGGADAPAQPPAAAAAGGSNRRQKLLQRMKGAGGVAAAGAVAAAAAAAATTAGAGPTTTGATGSSPVGSSAMADSTASTVGAGMATLDAAAEPPEDAFSTPLPSVGADFRSQMASMAAQLPPETDLSPDERQARELLAAILNPSSDEVRQVTGGDISDMLQRDLSAQQEFMQWLRSPGAKGPAGGADGGDGDGAEELSEAEAADLMAALEGMGLGGDWAELGAAQEEGMELGVEQEDGGDGAAAVDAAMLQVSELRKLMAQLGDADADDDGQDEARGDMSDEQVLAALKASDPALYELLKDVPDFDKLDLDLDLDLDPENLSEAELAELAAEAEAAGGGAGMDEEAELEALLRDMRGLGLMRGQGDGDADEDDEGDDVVDGADEDDEDGDAALGDLLEALDEDEDLDSRSKMKAQFALQSMFNQPADELAAKGTRGSAADEAAAAPAPAAAPPPPPRGTTGMARDTSDDDGGAAPPPMLPKPRPRPRG